jgi:hypothetical protein
VENIARIDRSFSGYGTDATTIGTNFIHFLANLMNTLAQKSIISGLNKN